jgi:lipopolysaccharide assembly protein A
MNFLKTLFWVVVAVSLAIFATRNWNDVTINLWGNLQGEVKLPALLLLTFLVGFLPPYLVLRGRIWQLRRKLALAERPVEPPPPSVTEMLETDVEVDREPAA